MTMFLLVSGMVLCIALGLVVSNYIALVLMMELTLWLFIFMVSSHYQLSLIRVSVKYFVSQTVGSVLLLLAGLWVLLMMDKSLLMTIMLLLGIMLKLGVFPMHFWVLPVNNGLPYPLIGILGSPLKVLPLSLMSSLTSVGFSVSQNPVLCVSVLSMLVGSALGVTSSNTRNMLGASSITHAGWFLLSAITTNAFFYFTLYSVALSITLCSLTFIKPLFSCFSLLVLSGLPPFSVFWGKLLVLASVMDMKLPLIFAMVALFSSFISLFYYLKFSFFFYLMHTY